MINDDRLRTQAPGIVIFCSSNAVFDVLRCAGGHMRNVDDATTTAQLNLGAIQHWATGATLVIMTKSVLQNRVFGIQIVL